MHTIKSLFDFQREIAGNIEFLDVHFRYPTRPTLRILRSFSLKCFSSGTTALVGPSGSGKSTTVALLQRFYDPLKGKILIDGHDIKALNIQWLRSIMGLVQQEPVLFNLSIRENIAYGDNSREITQNEIEAAARKANIHELIISLPQVFYSALYIRCHLLIFCRVMKHHVEQKVVNYQADKNKEVNYSMM